MITCISNLSIDIYSCSGSEITIPDGKLEEINSMPFKQAMEEMQKHQKPIAGVDLLRRNYCRPMFWKYKQGPLVFIFLSAFAGCLWMGKWTLNKQGDKSP